VDLSELEIQRQLALLETQRQASLRSVADSLMMGNDGEGRGSAVSTIRRRRYNTLDQRYQQAREYAVRSAWLARIALEQRIGMSLDSMTEDLLLVGAPHSWSNEVCTMTGIDYRRLREEGGLPGDNYAGEYVGEYVDKLEAVFESYSYDYPFADGTDTTVVSVRDEIVRSRVSCDVDVNNLLLYSNTLDTQQDPYFVAPPRIPGEVIDPGGSGPGSEIPLAPPIWHHQNCDIGGVSPQNCVSVQSLAEIYARAGDTTSSPYAASGMAEVSPRPMGYRVRFQPNRDPAALTSFNPDVAVVQTVPLEPGRYRLSWRARQLVALPYEPAMGGDPEQGAVESIPPEGAVVARWFNGTTYENLNSGAPQTYLGDGWALYYEFFELPQATDVEIAILPVLGTTITRPAQHVDVGGLMLEDVSSHFASLPVGDARARYSPGAFMATEATSSALLPVCEDTYGDDFRRHWRYDCTRLCPGGLGSCDWAPTACFWELNFSVSLEDLEQGRRFVQAGTALGNFNYRWEQLGVNVVGTSVRDCAMSTLPSTCYSDGTIPFSIYHTGDFLVRNHAGEQYSAPLFAGAIEHGRALSAERYLTNPLSSADRSLVDPFVRTELRGRPMAGRYTLRIWEEDALNFQAIEDVQLMIGYRYWTWN